MCRRPLVACPHDASSNAEGLEYMKVLAFAAEAWETGLVAGVLRDAATFANVNDKRLALSDVTTFQYEPHLIDGLVATGDLQVSSLESEFLSWQVPVRVPAPPKESLDSWLDRQASRIDRAQLINCDIILTPWELESWVLPTSPEWMERIAADIVLWTERQFDEMGPDLVLSVERRRMASVAAQIVAEHRGIPILSLIYSRVEQRWIIRTDGGIGMSEQDKLRIINAIPSSSAAQRATELANRVRRGAPLYESGNRTTDDSTSMTTWRNRRSEILGLAAAARSIGSRHLHPRGGRRAQRHKAIRYEQDFAGISLSELRTAVLRLYASLGGMKCLPKDFQYPEKPFVLWPLHKRPEDSGTALGRGLDEIATVLELRRRLPKSIDVVIREHPSMVGVRRSGFYRRLQLGGALIAGPASPTSELLARCSGVAGMSGTVLLEATLQGTPTLVLGEPEFLGCMSNVGWETLPSFVDQVLGQESVPLPEIPALRYLEWIFDNSDSQDSFYCYTSRKAEQYMIRSVAARYWNEAKRVCPSVTFP